MYSDVTVKDTQQSQAIKLFIVLLISVLASFLLIFLSSMFVVMVAATIMIHRHRKERSKMVTVRKTSMYLSIYPAIYPAMSGANRQLITSDAPRLM